MSGRDESWSNFFTKLGGAVAKGLELAGDIVNQIELAFDANAQRGVGILWLPKSRQALYYSIDWHSVGLDFRHFDAIEIHLTNVIFGLSMWHGVILSHRALMVREPVVKVSFSGIVLADPHPNNDGSDEYVLWSIVNQLKENLFTEWSYVSAVQRLQDENLQKVDVLLRQGHFNASDVASFHLYSLSKSNPRDTLRYILPIIPRAYKQHSTSHLFLE